jgi:hypothetical protein
VVDPALIGNTASVSATDVLHEDHQAEDERHDTTTEPERVELHVVRRSNWLRRGFVLLLVAVLAVTALGFFGYRSKTVSRTDGEITTNVTYGQFTRRGVTTPLTISIESKSDFGDDVSVAVASSWLEAMSVRSVSPQPDQESRTGDTVVWRFQQPKGNELQIAVDAEADSSAPPGWVDGSVAVAVGDQLIHQLTFRSWIWP